jgi:hypothetical protein
MKTYGGMEVQLHVLAVLPPGKEPPVPIVAGCMPELVWHPGCSGYSLVTLLIELSQLFQVKVKVKFSLYLTNQDAMKTNILLN